MAVSSREEVDIYDYQLVEFEDGTSDFVPNTWLYFDADLGKMVTKFMPPPYTVSKFDNLNLLIKKKAPVKFPPVSNWPTFPITLKGQAKTVEDADKKIELLKLKSRRKSCLYTEDSDYSPEEKAKKIEEKYRQKQVLTTENVMTAVPSIHSDESSVDSAWQKTNIKKLTAPKSLVKKYTKKSKQNVNRNNNDYSFSSSEDASLSDTSTTIFDETVWPQKNTSLQSTLKERIEKSQKSQQEPQKKARHKESIDSPSTTEKESTSKGLSEKRIEKATPKSTEFTVPIFIDDNQNVQFDHKTNKKSHKSSKSSIAKEKYKNASTDTKLLLEEFKNIKEELYETKNRLSRIELLLEALMTKLGSKDKRGFIIENQLNLPFKDVNDFFEFDNKLATEEQFRNDFLSSIQCIMDPNYVVTKSITNIIKKYMSKDLAMMFTNSKKSGDKMLLKNHEFHRCLIDSIIQTHLDKSTKICTSEKIVNEGISTVLSNAKDWDGGRKQRTKSVKHEA